MNLLRPILIIFIGLIINNLASTTKDWNCDLNNCKGTYQLNVSKEINFNIKMTKTKIILTEYPENVKMGFVKRKKRTIYCYEGTSIDPNTGCFEKNVNIVPSCGEVRSWSIKNECLIGKECIPDGECWGNSADWCTENRNLYQKIKTPKYQKYAGYRWMKFPHHTCVIDWECVSNVVSMPIYTSYNSDETSINPYLITDKNELRQYSVQLYENGFTNREDFLFCLLEKPHQPKREMLIANCYANSEDEKGCIIESDGRYKGLAITLDKLNQQNLRNLHFKLKGPLYVPDKAQIKNVGDNDLTEDNSWLKKLSELNRPATIEDVYEISNSLAISHQQSSYNLIKISQKIYETDKILKNIVESLAKKDNKLISNIINKESSDEFYTNWITPKIFEICPCKKLDFFKKGDCQNNMQYKNGLVKTINSTIYCKEIDGRVENLTLNTELQLNIESLKNLPFTPPIDEGIDMDVIKMYLEKEKSLNHESDHSYNSFKIDLDSVISKLNIMHYQQFFWTITCVVFWIKSLLKR